MRIISASDSKQPEVCGRGVAEAKRSERLEAAGRAASRWLVHPATHLILLAALATVQAFVSWRRWPDPLVDFGRELYIPWRLADGAVLFRDVEDFYGPLSQYFNALLFRVFGPGLMVLVTANLVIFAAIVTVLYWLLRRAWGGWSALLGGAVFVAVFGFSRFVYVGNFNYATPYAHETTHGVLVLLLLAASLASWLKGPLPLRSTAAGFLFGLTLVLKAEIVLAGAALVAASLVFQYRRSSGIGLVAISGLVAGAVAPTLAFAAYFSQHMPFRDAWSAAGRAWLNVLGTTRYIAEPAQLKYAGFDTPWRHSMEHGLATLTALAVFAAVWLLIRVFEKQVSRKSIPMIAAAGAAGLALASWCWSQDRWLECGKCLPGLILLYLGWQLVRVWRGRSWPTEEEPRMHVALLLALLGAALIARMILAGRIYQFGYFQAAIAAVVVVAVLSAEFPRLVAGAPAARIFGAMCVFGIIGPGIIHLMAKNHSVHGLLNSPMGQGRDRFFAFKASEGLTVVADVLQRQPQGSTLLVLPEGLMLNYLARMPSPLPHFFYYSAVTERGNEARIAAKLDQAPPDFIVMLPRDLTEYGIAKYGERSGAGADILAWMQGRYALLGWLREGGIEPEPPVNVVAYRGNYFQIYRLTR